MTHEQRLLLEFDPSYKAEKQRSTVHVVVWMVEKAWLGTAGKTEKETWENTFRHYVDMNNPTFLFRKSDSFVKITEFHKDGMVTVKRTDKDKDLLVHLSGLTTEQKWLEDNEPELLPWHRIEIHLATGEATSKVTNPNSTHAKTCSGQIWYGIGTVFTYHQNKDTGLAFLIEEATKKETERLEMAKKRLETISKAKYS